MTTSKQLTPKQLFSKILKEIHVPKGQRNTFGNYNFRSCEDILESFKALLKVIDPDNRVYLVMSEEVECINNRFYFKSTATINIDNETFSNQSFAREPDQRKGFDESQISGATISYCRKYALAGLLGLDDEKDADNKAPVNEPIKANSQLNQATPVNKDRPASEAQKKAVFAIAKNQGIQSPNIETLTFAEASDFIGKANKR